VGKRLVSSRCFSARWRLHIAAILSLVAATCAPFAVSASSDQHIDVQLTSSGPWIGHLIGFNTDDVQSVVYWIRDANGQWRSTDPVVDPSFDSPINWWEGDNDGYEVVTAHVSLTSGQELKDPGGWHWVDGHHTDPMGQIHSWTNHDGTVGAIYSPEAHQADIKGTEFWFRDALDEWHDVGPGTNSGEDADWLLQSFRGFTPDWLGPDNAVSVHVVWPGGEQLVDPANWATDIASAPTYVPSAPTSAKPMCGDPHAHVYNPDRLHLLAACVRVTGVVDAIRTEADGDLHVLLHLDPGQQRYINSKNSLEGSDLVLEPVCVDTPTQADATAACEGYTNPLTIPAVASHVSVTGAWVLDVDHGWMEIHPVSSFGAPVFNPSPKPTPAPPRGSPRPPVAFNYCGAPSNPWHYNFCSAYAGKYIYSPASGFCSYFNCIASFWQSTNGYVAECIDGTYSHSGGVSGACSHHGGVWRPLWA
jgi:hypothetical protein